jgi:hypothetical protein
MSRVFETIYQVQTLRSLSFPFDMLRYDGSTIATERDSAMIERTIRGEAMENAESVQLVHRGPDRDWKPNYDRWLSFGWRVIGFETSPIRGGW